MERYEYSPIPKIPDVSYFRAKIEKDLGLSVIGLTLQNFRDTLVVQFERPLTDVEKSKLDGLIASPPAPVSHYEFSPLTPEDIETEIGVRPVLLMIDPTTGTATCHFDTTLTPEQEALLEALLRSPMRFKKRTP